MKKQRRVFSAEFKLEAASLVLDQGYSILQACRSLDVGETALRRWVDQLQFERTGETPTTNALTPEQQKINLKLCPVFVDHYKTWSITNIKAYLSLT